MSKDYVELLHIRLREEIERCGYTLAAAARAIGDPSSQNLRDIVTGRKKCPAELVGRLAVIGVDISHVLIGIRAEQSTALKPEESAFLVDYRCLREEQQSFIRETVAALAAANGKAVN